MDRMDRNKNMVKNVSIISDTDSSFVSLDAWFVLHLFRNFFFHILDVVNHIKFLVHDITVHIFDDILCVVEPSIKRLSFRIVIRES